MCLLNALAYGLCCVGVRVTPLTPPLLPPQKPYPAHPPPLPAPRSPPQEAVDANKPPGAKGVYWKSLHVCTTMGPSLRLSVQQLQAVKGRSE